LKKVLITGGFGYLGGRIAQFLDSVGYEIHLGSRVKREAPSWLNNVSTSMLDWNDVNQLSESCSDMNVIVHTAGMNSEQCINDPIAAFESNALGTLRLLEAGRKAKIDQFIYFSTAHIYNSPLVGTISEETCPSNLHPYATSHLSAEFAVSFANSKKFFKGINLRLSNGFGKPSSLDVPCWKLFVNDLCKQSIETGKLKIFSNEKQKRDFIPISSISKTIGHLIENDITLRFDTYNLGSGYSISLMDMAKRIQNRCRVLFGEIPPIEINEKYLLEDEMDLEFRIERIKTSISWDNDISSIDDEIDETLLFCSKNFQKVSSS
jgi:UDP-glucose 4-epimerase